eukprot:2574364-Alexandrium_andersonii.AAC.1
MRNARLPSPAMDRAWARSARRRSSSRPAGGAASGCNAASSRSVAHSPSAAARSRRVTAWIWLSPSGQLLLRTS